MFLFEITKLSLHGFRCRKYCNKEGYIYYGVQSARKCFCGNNYPDDNKMTDESSCDKDCPGDPSFKCGGSGKANIYLVEVEGKLVIFFFLRQSKQVIKSYFVLSFLMVHRSQYCFSLYGV